jgi:hypothetical protein
MADDDGGNAWDDLIDDLRQGADDFLSGISDDTEFRDTLHELYVQEPDAFKEALYEITDDPRERHELWTAAMYE